MRFSALRVNVTQWHTSKTVLCLHRDLRGARVQLVYPQVCIRGGEPGFGRACRARVGSRERGHRPLRSCPPPISSLGIRSHQLCRPGRRTSFRTANCNISRNVLMLSCPRTGSRSCAPRWQSVASRILIISDSATSNNNKILRVEHIKRQQTDVHGEWSVEVLHLRLAAIRSWFLVKEEIRKNQIF
jgi:hypothetical protein